MKRPTIHEDAAVARDAAVVGDVTLKKDSSVWYHAVLRGDLQPIVIGEGSNIQDNAVLHVDAERPLTVGRMVTVGHGAILHGCTVEDEVLIGMGAIVLNGAVIGKRSMIAAGALVPQNMIVPEGSLVMGSPARIRRDLTEEEKLSVLQNAQNYIRESKEMETTKEKPRLRSVGKSVNMLSNRIRRRLHAYTAGGELSGAEGKALHFLLAQDRDVYQKDLEEEYGLRPPTVTELLKKMEQKGFLCRQPSENDARCKKIIVSGKALAYKEHVCKDLKELEKEVTEGIDEKDLDVFFRVMEQMLENLS